MANGRLGSVLGEGFGDDTTEEEKSVMVASFGE